MNLFCSVLWKHLRSWVAWPIPLFDGATIPSSRLDAFRAARAGAVQDDAQRHRREPARSVLDGDEHGAKVMMSER